MSVRKATVDDIEAVLPMTKGLHVGGHVNRWSKWDGEKWAEWLDRCIRFDGAECFVAESDSGREGFSSVVSVPAYWDDSVKIAQVVTIWVTPEGRGKGHGKSMLEEMFEWGRGNGCVMVAVSASQKMHPKKTGKMYRSCGLEMAEIGYLRRI